MPRSLVSAVIVPFFLLFPLQASAQVRSIEPDVAGGTAKAVVVDGQPLVHTGQILPQVAKGDAAAQFAAVVDRLKTVLARSGSSLDGVVKLNVYVAGDDHAACVRKRLPAVFAGAHKPAVCFVVTPLPNASALVAVDAVAVVRKQERHIIPQQPFDEPVRPRNEFVPAIDDAVHVDGKSVWHFVSWKESALRLRLEWRAERVPAMREGLRNSRAVE